MDDALNPIFAPGATVLAYVFKTLRTLPSLS